MCTLEQSCVDLDYHTMIAIVAFWRPKAQTVVVMAEALWIGYRHCLRFCDRSTCMGQWMMSEESWVLDVLRFKELWSLEAVEYSK